MKKLINISIVLLIFICSTFSTISYAHEITLDQIAEKFNNCTLITTYKETANQEYLAEAVEGKIIINGYNNFHMEGVLDNNIFTIEGNLTGPNLLLEWILASEIIDCIGQLQGYMENELNTTINSDEIANYTLENEGFELIQSGTSFQFKIDISKKVPLLDFSDVYFTVSDLKEDQNFLNIIRGDGFFQTSKKHLIFYKTGYEGYIFVYVGEPNNLTQSTYKSILSALEVIFDTNKAAQYFQSNYPDYSLGNYSFDGIEVEINPVLDSLEETVFQNHSLMKLSIDKNIVYEKIANFSEEEINDFNIIEENPTIDNDFNVLENEDITVENTINDSNYTENTINNEINENSSKNDININYSKSDANSKNNLIILCCIIIALLLIFFILLFVIILKSKNKYK